KIITLLECYHGKKAFFVQIVYQEGSGDNLIKSEPLSYTKQGVFSVTLSGNYANQYYTYLVNVQGSEWEVVDPYAKSTGVNGERGMILAKDEGMPEGFKEDTYIQDTQREDVILYEMSVRDYTSDIDSGILHKGKFLGLTEENTVNSAGDSTGLSYLAELGITHVHLLPIQDFGGVDEEHPEEAYNWGYNPVNYFVPEGSYATDPYHGEVRVQELREMIQSLHGQGIGVVMDVVYNHTYYSADSNFNRIVPGYYHRIKEDGSFSDGSKCGNELATERAMVRKYVIDSVKYWMEEYHVDGFRFDLMGLIDVETMKELEKEVFRLNPHAVVYGEGWDAGETIYQGERMESANAYLTPGIGTFNNVFRRAVQNYICGFVEEESTLLGMKFGVAGAGNHPDTVARMGTWTAKPLQCINYASCHDGYTLWDLITLNCPEEEQEFLKRRDRFGAACVLLCQGTPFLHSGEEFLRTKVSPNNPDVKYGNSYDAGDEVNALDWKSRTENKDVLEYYRGLISFRKEHRGLRYVTQRQLNKNLVFMEDLPENVMGYYAREPINLFMDNQICLLFNPTQEAVEFLPASGIWEIYVDDHRAGTECLEVIAEGETLCVEGVSALAAVRTVVRVDRIVITIIVTLLTMAVLCIVIRKSRRKKYERNESGGNHK
ncbi:MAG: type I pullulanase, partial [Lachnospiraceae bacterium]|nr:type I pullulanase [Lachnospiraceae bacterium]